LRETNGSSAGNPYGAPKTGSKRVHAGRVVPRKLLLSFIKKDIFWNSQKNESSNQ
jgi:hypothetical protein